MYFICPSCKTEGQVPDALVPEYGCWHRCKNCNEGILLKPCNEEQNIVNANESTTVQNAMSSSDLETECLNSFVNVQNKPLGMIFGKVFNSKGNEVINCCVSLYDKSGKMHKRCITNSMGEYSFEDLEPNIYKVKIEPLHSQGGYDLVYDKSTESYIEIYNPELEHYNSTYPEEWYDNVTNYNDASEICINIDTTDVCIDLKLTAPVMLTPVKLIVCDDCGGNISINALSCPHCGNTKIPAANQKHLEIFGIPKCPTCGSTALEKIGTTSKVMPLLLFGFYGAGNITKSFKCKSCGYKW